MNPTDRKWSQFDLEDTGNLQYPLHVGVWDPAPPGPLTMDTHQGMEIGLVLRGRIERHFEDYVFTAKAGDVHLCSAWEPHGWQVRTEASQVVLIFLADVLEDGVLREVPWLSFFTVPPSRRPRTTTPEMRRALLQLGRRIHFEGREQPKGWQIGVRVLLYELLLLFHRYWSPPHNAAVSDIATATHFARIMPAVQLVHRQTTRYISSEEAAAACGLRRSRFTTLFHHTLGVNFQTFCRRARLARVAHLLLTTDLPTDTLAEETGFTDGSHLHRTFVQYYGVTPGRYRAQHRQ